MRRLAPVSASGSARSRCLRHLRVMRRRSDSSPCAIAGCSARSSTTAGGLGCRPRTICTSLSVTVLPSAWLRRLRLVQRHTAPRRRRGDERRVRNYRQRGRPARGFAKCDPCRSRCGALPEPAGQDRQDQQDIDDHQRGREHLVLLTGGVHRETAASVDPRGLSADLVETSEPRLPGWCLAAPPALSGRECARRLGAADCSLGTRHRRPTAPRSVGGMRGPAGNPAGPRGV